MMGDQSREIFTCFFSGEISFLVSRDDDERQRLLANSRQSEIKKGRFKAILGINKLQTQLKKSTTDEMKVLWTTFSDELMAILNENCNFVVSRKKVKKKSDYVFDEAGSLRP